MNKGILGRKIGMTRLFSVSGKSIPITVIEVEPNVVLQIKTIEKDGYKALKLGVADKRENLVNKPDLGQFKKANTKPKYFVKEIADMEGYQVGDNVNVNLFESGEFVDVVGTSKGKGFAGVIKRHNYARGPSSHGSGFHRGIGSMGAIAPNRIFRGKKMPGRLGHAQVTVQNLEVIAVILEKNALLVKGSVPGPKKQFVVVKNSVKKNTKNNSVELINYTKKTTEINNNEINEMAIGG